MAVEVQDAAVGWPVVLVLHECDAALDGGDGGGRGRQDVNVREGVEVGVVGRQGGRSVVVVCVDGGGRVDGGGGVHGIVGPAARVEAQQCADALLGLHCHALHAAVPGRGVRQQRQRRGDAAEARGRGRVHAGRREEQRKGGAPGEDADTRRATQRVGRGRARVQHGPQPRRLVLEHAQRDAERRRPQAPRKWVVQQGSARAALGGRCEEVRRDCVAPCSSRSSAVAQQALRGAEARARGIHLLDKAAAAGGGHRGPPRLRRGGSGGGEGPHGCRRGGRREHARKHSEPGEPRQQRAPVVLAGRVPSVVPVGGVRGLAALLEDALDAVEAGVHRKQLATEGRALGPRPERALSADAQQGGALAQRREQLLHVRAHRVVREHVDRERRVERARREQGHAARERGECGEGATARVEPAHVQARKGVCDSLGQLRGRAGRVSVVGGRCLGGGGPRGRARRVDAGRRAPPQAPQLAAASAQHDAARRAARDRGGGRRPRRQDDRPRDGERRPGRGAGQHSCSGDVHDAHGVPPRGVDLRGGGQGRVEERVEGCGCSGVALGEHAQPARRRVRGEAGRLPLAQWRGLGEALRGRGVGCPRRAERLDGGDVVLAEPCDTREGIVDALLRNGALAPQQDRYRAREAPEKGGAAQRHNPGRERSGEADGELREHVREDGDEDAARWDGSAGGGAGPDVPRDVDGHELLPRRAVLACCSDVQGRRGLAAATHWRATRGTMHSSAEALRSRRDADSG